MYRLGTKPKLLRVPHQDIAKWDPKLEYVFTHTHTHLTTVTIFIIYVSVFYQREMEVRRFFEAPNITNILSSLDDHTQYNEENPKATVSSSIL